MRHDPRAWLWDAREAAAAIAEFTARIPELRAIVAFRNLLIDGYASVDDAIVWRTITEKLPALREALDGLLAELGSPDT
jgi:uncharacterized protein with HEPN domain